MSDDLFNSAQNMQGLTVSVSLVCGKSGKDIKALNAHIAGLMCRDETSFIIRLGGTSIIADFWDDFSHGDLNPKVWSDIDDIDEITSLPANYPHRPVDIALHEAAEKYDGKLKVAVICPPGIYGQGRGMGNTQSLYVPALYEEAVRRGATFYCSTGGNLRGWVHIEDLMKVYLALVESAMAGGGNATWGKEGYYFTESQEASQLDMAKHAGTILKAKGLISTAEPEKPSVETIRSFQGMGGGSTSIPNGIYTWAANTRTRGDRTRKLLGYKPDAPSFWETMESDLMAAKRALEAKS